MYNIDKGILKPILISTVLKILDVSSLLFRMGNLF